MNSDRENRPQARGAPVPDLPCADFLGQLLANDHLVVALKDRDGRYLRISRLLDRLYRGLGADVLGKTAREVLPPAMGEIIHRDDCAVLQSQRSDLYEQTFTIDGIERTFLTSRFVLRDADGEVCGLCVIGGEITDRKRFEEALRNAAVGVSAARDAAIQPELVRLLATTLRVDLAFIALLDDVHGEHARVVAAWHRDRFLDAFDYRLAGTPCASVIGRQFFCVPDDLAVHFPDDRMLLELGLVSYAAYPLCADDGAPIGLIAIADSRHLRNHYAVEAMLRIFSTRAASEFERQRRDAALAESEERFRTTVEAALDCIIGMDAAGRIIEFNPAAEACFGYRSAAVLGQPLADLLIPERQREAHRNGLAHHLATGEGRYLGRRVEVSALRADGSAFPAELTINCAQGPNGPLYIGYLRDITDLKRAESERERLAAQLRQAQKMEAIGHLAGGIAHDFNNILTSILGYTVMAEEQAAASENSRLLHHLEQIRYAGERARDLIAQLLTFSRGERGAVRPIDPRPLVTETVKLFGSTFPSSVRLRLELGGDVPPALCDPVQFEQVLVNLCINARDAIGGHGEIVITLRRQGAADLVCTACRQPVSGEFVELAVLDDGHGIPPGLLDRIFEPFFTTKPAGAGSGMGLATTHGIVHEHGGHIVVESPPAGGTLFRVLLPPAASTRTAGTDASTEQRGGRPRKVLRGHVLLVEDEASVRGFMREFLESRGYSVSEAVDGQAALDWFAASASPPDAVLTDQSMPRLNGIEFARALRRHGARVPVLLYSGHGEPLDAGAAAAAGISGVLNKPLDLHELVERLAAAIAR